jgi:hypothetical protein
MSRLDAIEARAEAATPGPWAIPNANVFRVIAPDAEHHNPPQGMTPPYPWRVICEEGEADANGHDAAFIAAARTDVPDLVGLVRTLGEALESLIVREEGLESGHFTEQQMAAWALYDEWGSA